MRKPICKDGKIQPIAREKPSLMYLTAYNFESVRFLAICPCYSLPLIQTEKFNIIKI
jgi:hypothetical protein